MADEKKESTSSKAEDIKYDDRTYFDHAYGRYPNGKPIPNNKIIYTGQEIKGSGTYFGRTPNENKIINLAFYTYGENEFLGKDLPQIIADLRKADCDKWDNWKDGLSKVINSGGAKTQLPAVPEKVRPELKDLTIKGGIDFEFLNAADSLKQGGGSVLGTLKEISDNVRTYSQIASAVIDATGKSNADGTAASGALHSARSYDLASKFDEFNLINPAKITYKSPESISLDFSFGSAGFFDGEIEVVRPIMALINTIAPQYYGSVEDGSYRNHSIVGPAASPTQFYAAMWGATTGMAGDSLKAIVSSAKTVEKTITNVASSGNIKGALKSISNGVGDLAEKVSNAVLQAQDAAVSAAAEVSVFLFYRLGQYIAGPFQITDMHYNFDYNYVDESGYPYKGTITISLKNVFKPTAVDLLYQAGYLTLGKWATDSNTGNKSDTSSSTAS